MMQPPDTRLLRPGILLDRDGTIIVDYGYVGSVDRVEFIDGAPEAIARFNRAAIPVAVVTNQAIGAPAVYLESGERQRPGVWPFPSLAAAASFIMDRITA